MATAKKAKPAPKSTKKATSKKAAQKPSSSKRAAPKRVMKFEDLSERDKDLLVLGGAAAAEKYGVSKQTMWSRKNYMVNNVKNIDQLAEQAQLEAMRKERSQPPYPELKVEEKTTPTVREQERPNIVDTVENLEAQELVQELHDISALPIMTKTPEGKYLIQYNGVTLKLNDIPTSLTVNPKTLTLEVEA